MIQIKAAGRGPGQLGRRNARKMERDSHASPILPDVYPGRHGAGRIGHRRGAAMQMQGARPIIVAAALGAIVAIPVAWTIARRLLA